MTGTEVAAPVLPAGYAIRRERGATVVALPSVIEAVIAAIAGAGTLHDAAAAAGGAVHGGRDAAYRMAGVGGDWLVRHYRRGGLVARVLSDQYLRFGEPRPLRELRASAAARARGVDTPEILAGVIYPAGLLYRADLATRFVYDARDLASIALGPARATQDDRFAAWRATGALLRTAFDAGVEHADLNLRNILIAGAGSKPRAVLLDLDRAKVHDRAVNARARDRMLARLHRSRIKLERAAGQTVGPPELDALETSLRGDDG